MKSLFYIITISFLGLVFLFSGMKSIPVSIALPGMIRPIQERTGIISLTSGILDSIYVKEGQSVSPSELLFRIKNYDRDNQIAQLNYEITWRAKYLDDLKSLLNKKPNDTALSQVNHPVLRQQYFRFKHSTQELTFSLDKAKKNLEVAAHLAKEKVIAPQELFDKETEYNRLMAAREAFLTEQPLSWEQELEIKQQELKQFETQHLQLLENEYRYLIKAPVGGIVQEVHTLYQGGVIQAGQLLGNISPEVELIVECLASPKNVGLLLPGQEARFQIDAFDYKYFGLISGKIISIDNDFTLMDHKPVYKIRCSISSSRLQLKNGYSVHLKKGMTLNARFIITERALWQLLWDTVDDWLNPINNRY